MMGLRLVLRDIGFRRHLFPETLRDFQASGDLKFYLTDESTVFYFDPYEIAPYASDIVEFLIPYDALRGVLHPEYAQRL